MARATVEALSFSLEKKRYIIEVLDPVLEELVQSALLELPRDPVGFLLERLRVKSRSGPSTQVSVSAQNAALKKELRMVTEQLGALSAVVSSAKKKKATFGLEVTHIGSIGSRELAVDDAHDSGDGSSDEDDVAEVELARIEALQSFGARSSVSAEVFGDWNKKRLFKPPVHKKSTERMESLRKTLQRSFLFSSLEQGAMGIVLDAFQEVAFEEDARIISEGDDGECLYVIEKGSPVVKKLVSGFNKVLKMCQPGDVFGELALLYNCPRSATVVATDRCCCWRLDRETFTHIVKDSAMQRAANNSAVLSQVSVFRDLDKCQVSQLVDALHKETFRKDDVVVRQGDRGDKFYIVDEGALYATKRVGGGAEPCRVMDYGPGDYFGELALLQDQPRAASIVVASETAQVLSMDRRTFDALLGPLGVILERGAAAYK